MAGWAGDLSNVTDVWWETAYQVFLKKHPLQLIWDHAEYYRINNTGWNDFGFSITSVVPYYGEIHGVDTRAIIVVLAKARLFEGKAAQRFQDLRDYIQRLIDTDLGEPGKDLQQGEVAMINVMMKLMYNNNGDPIQRDHPQLLLDLTNAQMNMVFHLIHAQIRPVE